MGFLLNFKVKKISGGVLTKNLFQGKGKVRYGKFFVKREGSGHGGATGLNYPKKPEQVQVFRNPTRAGSVFHKTRTRPVQNFVFKPEPGEFFQVF